MDNRLTEPQRRRLQRFGAAESVDVHCHCLPGIDDGPADAAESVALCRALADDGFTTVVATPHQLGRYDRRNSARLIRAAVESLSGMLAAERVPLTVVPGADVRIDERLVPLIDAGEVLTVGGSGAYVLLELPHDVYIDPVPVIRLLGARGLRAVMTHPERHKSVRARPDAVTQWIDAGAVLQVTAGSLLGMFGDDAERSAWEWLAAGRVALVATDSHDTTRRPPCMTRALDAIERRLGGEIARRVCVDNPLRVLRHRREERAPVDASRPTATSPAAGPRRWGKGVAREA